MDDSNIGDRPLPQPRVNVKKPVPLPRHSKTKKKEEISNMSEYANDVETKPKLNYTNSLRKSFKTVSENVQEKGTAVLQNTKNVGAKIEKSVRGILSKRQAVVSMPDPLRDPEEGVHAFERCSSLPESEIFSSITFGSPLVTNDTSEMNETSEIVESEPPSYPPPPLPDESIYDELQSSKSSVADSFYSIPSGGVCSPDSFYEEVPRFKKLSLFDGSDSDSSFTSDAVSTQSKNITRSDSWSFYDSPAALGHNYVNVNLDGNRVVLNSVDNIYSIEPTKTPKMEEVSGSTSKSGSISSSKSVANELYENWEIGEKSTEASEERPVLKTTRSVIYEFDPLFEETPIVPKLSGDQQEMSDEESNVGEIPDPPERYDSLTEGVSSTSQGSVSPDPPRFYLKEAKEEPPHPCLAGPEIQIPEISERDSGDKKKSNLARWSSMKRAIKMVADGTPWTPITARRNQRTKQAKPQEGRDSVTRPALHPSPNCLHQGYILRSPSNGERLKDFVQRWAQLSEGKLSLSSEKGIPSKEIISLEAVLSISHISDHKVSNDGEEVFCWEMSTGSRSRSHVLGCLSSSEARLWMQKILESMTSAFPSLLTAHFTRAGWCFLKEGISGSWKGVWVLIENRVLYYSAGKGKVIDVDLKKARCIVLQNDGESYKGVSEDGGYILVDSPEGSLYLQLDTPRETKTWKQVIKSAAVNNGPSLSDQQLTKDDIPVIVDKCINFVYAHGSMSEGIYRRSGSNSNVSKLLSELRKDAWAVQLSRQDYTEYDVANALKRFFRDLPEPLLSPILYKYFCNAASIKCSRKEKVSMYRSALEKLAPINYVTTRRLIGHLYFIHEQSEKNRMPTENLASVWGPTLMHVEGNGVVNWASREREVVAELIQLYKSVFLVDGEEVAREERIREVLERVHNSPLLPQRPSGDLRIWVYIASKESGNCVNITVGPQCDAASVCQELHSRTEFGPHELCLTESVLGGALSRPLHHSEKVLDTVLRWGYWDSCDCKDNYLVLTPNSVFREILPLAKPPISKCGELKYADIKSKSFKVYLFEFSQAKLSYYKDRPCSIKLAEWKIEDIVWYIGHEPKRNPQTRWAITFISKNHKLKRSKENPFFGHTIAGSTKEEQLQWMAAMLLGEYQHSDLLPRPNLLE